MAATGETHTYVALLRGINVSGQKIIRMEDLRKLFEELGFGKVATYIQSGNVVFQSRGNATAVTKSIESGIEKKFSFQVPVIVRTVGEMGEIVAGNPFRKTKLGEGERVYVTFLSQPPEKSAIQKLNAQANEIDTFHVINREVFILCRKGYGTSKFSNTFMEKCLGVKATTRNLETTMKLAELGKGI